MGEQVLHKGRLWCAHYKVGTLSRGGYNNERPVGPKSRVLRPTACGVTAVDGVTGEGVGSLLRG